MTIRITHLFSPIAIYIAFQVSLIILFSYSHSSVSFSWNAVILNEMTAIYAYEPKRRKNTNRKRIKWVNIYLIALLAKLYAVFFYYCTQFTQFFCTWLYMYKIFYGQYWELIILVKTWMLAYSCEFLPNYFPIDIHSMRKKMQERFCWKILVFILSFCQTFVFFS